MPRANVVERVLQVCRDDPVLDTGGAVVVAVSGGPDSTTLLHALWRGSRRLKLDLTAAHFDHAWRRESASEANKVAALCSDLGVPLVSRRAQPGGARSEDAARRVRYRFLESVAVKVGAATIALGHTADDQAETVLLHLIRGSGLEGIAAMAPREGLRFRPLLATWRADVESYCRGHGLQPVEDRSNRSRRFTRNRLRLDLIPALESYNPKVKEALVRLSIIARQEHDAVEAVAAGWLAKTRGRPSRLGLSTEPEAVQVAILRGLWAAAADGASAGAGDAARLRQARRLVVGEKAEGMVSLGRGLHLFVEPSTFYIAEKRRR